MKKDYVAPETTALSLSPERVLCESLNTDGLSPTINGFNTEQEW